MSISELQKKATIVASGNYLTDPLPEDYWDMSLDELHEFVELNAWQPFEHREPEYVLDQIEVLADSYIRFLNAHSDFPHQYK